MQSSPITDRTPHHRKKYTAAARVRRATINEGVFMSILFSILDTLKWML
jgi:hypothetical protein